MDLEQELISLNRRKQDLQADWDRLRQEAVSRCVALICQFELTEKDLFGARRKAAPKPRYKNPDGPETWSGTGVHPKWFDRALEGGATRESMLIQAGG